MPVPDYDKDIRSSWDANAAAWTEAVRGSAIPSRLAGTDQAMIDAVQSLQPPLPPYRLIDMACGEGWLVRRLSAETGCEAVGMDASKALIDAAREAHGDGCYLALSYEEAIARPQMLAGPYDAILFNFSLLDDGPAAILAAVRGALDTNGVVVIQTVHPWTARGEGAYMNGWRNETFAAFGGEGWQSMPWFYRTLGSWFREIEAAGLEVTKIGEPLDPNSGTPLSLLFHCRQRVSNEGVV